MPSAQPGALFCFARDSGVRPEALMLNYMLSNTYVLHCFHILPPRFSAFLLHVSVLKDISGASKAG